MSAKPQLGFFNPTSLPSVKGYSHVVTLNRGTTVYIAGQVALDSHGRLIGEADLAAQTRQVFTNIGLALEAVGASFQDLIKLTYFLTDISQIAIVRDIRDQFITIHQPPASSAVEVSKLFRDDLLIEIEAIAVIPEH
jgi:reactive intermediate/imine deaminase